LLKEYLKKEKLRVQLLGRGFAWLDTGTYDGLLEASNFVGTKGYITRQDVQKIADTISNTDYGKYLKKISDE